MVTVYLDDYPVEHCFTIAELDDALQYWKSRGNVTVRVSRNIYILR